MRILYFSRDYTTHDHRFLSALGNSDHEVYFLRLEKQNFHLEERPLPANVHSIDWVGGKEPAHLNQGLAYLRGLKKILTEIKPDIVHAGPIQKCALLTALAGFKSLVSMSWGSDLLKDADRNIFWKFATKLTLKQSQHLIGDCQAVKEKALSFDIPEQNITLFPWGIDLDKFKPGRNSHFRSEREWQNKFVILSLRSWEPIYGVDCLVEAFCMASKKNDQLRLILLGGGSQERKIRSILEKYDMLDRVFIGGQVNQDDLPGYYHAADLYISASHSDGSSVSLMEALGSGTPVLVSDIPGNEEWITEGQTGWLFPDGNVEALAEKIHKVVSQTQNMDEVGMNARGLAEERADWNKNSAILLDVYEQVLSTKY